MHPMRTPASTRAERVPVWTALSELFLDTELDEADLRHIAGRLRQSSYEPAEIERILRDEVLPAFGSNLVSVAGQWTPWTEAEVLGIMTRALERNGLARALARLFSTRCWRMIERDWNRIAAMLSTADA